MAKAKTLFACSECGYESAKWLGKCPDCDIFNTMMESTRPEAAIASLANRKHPPAAQAGVCAIEDIPMSAVDRADTGINEFNRVLGGGIVDSSLTLVGGDPGVGKSTLLLQVCAHLSANAKTLYVSGEESARQIRLRAQRVGAMKKGLFVLAENDVQAVLDRALEMQPAYMVIDSIQTMYRPDMQSAPGSVSQVRESAALIMRYAKAQDCAVFLVGHVTKEGAIAGPRVLEHMVDAVLYFEGDASHQYRILRAVKNRFGSVNEIGLFAMHEHGMIEVENPSDVLLSERAHNLSGCAVLCAMEGTRPMLVDVQALVSNTIFGNPRRMASGVDQGRLSLLLAVLDKRAGYALYNQDVYINVAGGLALTEPACDLAICMAVASAQKNIPIPPKWAIMGEVGLAGEIRAVSQTERRLAECLRLGFTHCLIAKDGLSGIKIPDGLTVAGVDEVAEAWGRVARV